MIAEIKACRNPYLLFAALKPLIGGTLGIEHIRTHWDEILPLVTSGKQGTVTASLMPRELGGYPGRLVRQAH